MAEAIVRAMIVVWLLGAIPRLRQEAFAALTASRWYRHHGCAGLVDRCAYMQLPENQTRAWWRWQECRMEAGFEFLVPPYGPVVHRRVGLSLAIYIALQLTWPLWCASDARLFRAAVEAIYDSRWREPAPDQAEFGPPVI